MELKEGTSVYTALGEKVGDVSRIVIQPDSKQVTHLIIQKGFFFTEDKVVPMSVIAEATQDKVTLRGDIESLDDFQSFEESHYVYVNGRPEPLSNVERPVPTLYWYPPFGIWGVNGGGPGYDNLPLYTRVKEENIPEDTVALKEGARVISSDGKHLGDIERVFVDPTNDRATHVLISKGLLVKERRVLPSWWMTHILDDEIYLSVDAVIVENLPEHVPQD